MDFRRSKKDFWFTCVDTDVLRDKKLSGTSRLVFAILCSYANFNTRSCFPKIKTLAEDAGFSERTIQKALSELEERGVLKRVVRYRKEDGAQISSEYLLYGFHASCYEQEATPPSQDSGSVGEADFTGAVNPDSDQELYQENYIKNTLKGEAELPDSENQKKQKNNYAEKSQENSVPQTEKIPGKTENEIYSPDAAPDIMRPTARYLLQRTGRENLTWDEISALRELSNSQFPTRVQKEIDIACERFQRVGRSMKFLNFGYIAAALRNQPTRKLQAKSNTQLSATTEIKPVQYSDKEVDAILKRYGYEGSENS